MNLLISPYTLAISNLYCFDNNYGFFPYIYSQSIENSLSYSFLLLFGISDSINRAFNLLFLSLRGICIMRKSIHCSSMFKGDPGLLDGSYRRKAFYSGFTLKESNLREIAMIIFYQTYSSMFLTNSDSNTWNGKEDCYIFYSGFNRF